MKICGIYKITSPSNKIYIGQSIDIFKRWSCYKSKGCYKQAKLHASLKKYGADKHKFEILCQCSREELNNLEIYYIDLYQSFNTEFGMNLISGGNAANRVSDETRKKMSTSMKGNKNGLGKKHTEESKKKMSLFKKGMKLTEQHKENLSKSKQKKKKEKIIYANMDFFTKRRFGEDEKELNKENYKKVSAIVRQFKIKIIPPKKRKKITWSIQRRQKMIMAMKNRKPVSETTKLKTSLSKKGKPGSRLGKKLSVEHIEKLRNAKLGKNYRRVIEKKLASL